MFFKKKGKKEKRRNIETAPKIELQNDFFPVFVTCYDHQ